MNVFFCLQLGVDFLPVPVPQMQEGSSAHSDWYSCCLHPASAMLLMLKLASNNTTKAVMERNCRIGGSLQNSGIVTGVAATGVAAFSRNANGSHRCMQNASQN